MSHTLGGDVFISGTVVCVLSEGRHLSAASLLALCSGGCFSIKICVCVCVRHIEAVCIVSDYVWTTFIQARRAGLGNAAHLQVTFLCVRVSLTMAHLSVVYVRCLSTGFSPADVLKGFNIPHSVMFFW